MMTAYEMSILLVSISNACILQKPFMQLQTRSEQSHIVLVLSALDFHKLQSACVAGDDDWVKCYGAFVHLRIPGDRRHSKRNSYLILIRYQQRGKTNECG